MATPELGPKMKALPNDRWRAMVQRCLEQGTKNITQAAQDAGFGGKSREALRVTAHTVFHDARFQEALHEEAQKRMNGLLLISALRVHGELLDNPQTEGAVRLKAAQMVYDRAGLHAVSEHKSTVQHIGSDVDTLRRIVAIATKLGIDPEKLVGNRMKALEAPTIEVEYEEVPDKTVAEAMEDGTYGLESLI